MHPIYNIINHFQLVIFCGSLLFRVLGIIAYECWPLSYYRSSLLSHHLEKGCHQAFAKLEAEKIFPELS